MTSLSVVEEKIGTMFLALVGNHESLMSFQAKATSLQGQYHRTQGEDSPQGLYSGK